MRQIVVSILFFASANSTAQVFDWAGHFENSGTAYCEAISVDNESNVISAGRFTTPMDFDPGLTNYEFTPSGPGNGFFSKLDSAGSFVWAKQLRGISSTGSIYIADMTVDSDENIYATGWFRDSVDFDPGPNTSIHVELSEDGGWQEDIFIIKLSSLGELIWIKSFGSPTYSVSNAIWERGDAIALDDSSNIYVTGTFADTVDFDLGPGIQEVVVPQGEKGAFVLKLDADANFIWVKTWLGIEPDDITVDEFHNPHITGTFNGLVDFDPSQSITTLSASYHAIFVSKLDTDGGFKWARKLARGLYEESNCIAVDNDGNVYTGGRFENTDDFDPGPDEFLLTPIVTPSRWDAFVCKLDSLGQFVWAVGFGGEFHDEVQDLIIDNSGDILCTGEYSGTAVFHPDTSDFATPVLGQYWWNDDAFVAKITSNGQLLWSKRIGAEDDDVGNGIATDFHQNVYVNGLFASIVDFDPGPDTNYLSGTFNTTPFVLKLKPCKTEYSSFVAFGCENYSSPSGNYTWESTGIYSDTLQNLVGCDSIVEVELTIFESDSNIAVDFVTQSLTTITPADTYQWLNCLPIVEPIIGETNQIFQPATSGYYAVVTSTNGCLDTSTCVFYSGVDIKPANSPMGPKVYPDPAGQVVYVQTTSSQVSIIDSSGKMQFSVAVRNNQANFDVSDLANGVYFIQTDSGLSTKLIIQH